MMMVLFMDEMMIRAHDSVLAFGRGSEDEQMMHYVRLDS